MGKSAIFGNPFDYAQIGTKYYRKIKRRRLDGSIAITLELWRKDFIIREVSKDELYLIEKYEGFCYFPEHIHYNRRVINCYNRYEPLAHKPAPGEWPVIRQFLEHIFGEQIEYGLDYLQIMYIKPTQHLPILVLVSEARSTGKTTFLNFLGTIYGENMAFNRSDDISSRFNSDWAGKNVIGIDEAVANTMKDSEHLKALCTARNFVVEEKFSEKVACEPFAKIILCSNDTNCPVIIDKYEDRYWVREIPHLAKIDTELVEKMKAEIPHFLFALQKRALFVPKPLSRTWFNSKDLETDALRRIRRNALNNDEYDVANCLLDFMNQHNLDEISLTDTEIRKVLKDGNVCIPKNLHKIIAFQWKTPQAGSKMVYTSYVGDEPHRAEGRYYTFRKDDLLKKVEG